MSAAGSYPLGNVTSRRAAPVDDSPARPGSSRPDDADGSRRPRDLSADPDAATERPLERVDLSGLSIAGITRRRVGLVAGAFLAIWIVVVFARQVGDATAASNRAAQLAADNAALAAEVQSLQSEVDRIVRPEVVAIAARGERLGDAKETPFTLDPAVAAPVDGAPGSASVRLGATSDRQTPLEAWLSLLFGPAD
jgi:cell division protein FtsB